MTDTQRRALHLAGRKGGAVVKGPGRTVGPDEIAYKTAQALIAKGWATQPERKLLTTSAGRAAIAAPQYNDGLYLHAKLHRGYTDNPRHAPKGEPQPMDKPSSTWQIAAQRATAEAKLTTRADRKEQAAQLANRARTASGKQGWRTTAPAGPLTIRYLADAA